MEKATVPAAAAASHVRAFKPRSTKHRSMSGMCKLLLPTHVTSRLDTDPCHTIAANDEASQAASVTRKERFPSLE